MSAPLFRGRSSLLAFAVATMALGGPLSLSCGSSDAGTSGAGGGAGAQTTACAPGDQKWCACLGGHQGVQQCLAFGTRWGECVGCSAATTTTTSSTTDPDNTGGAGGAGSSGGAGGTTTTTCQKDCTHRDCDVDPVCGESCGTCPEGSVCTPRDDGSGTACLALPCVVYHDGMTDFAPCGLGHDGADCGSCGPGYTCLDGDQPMGGRCTKDPNSDCGTWVHHADGSSTQSPKTLCCLIDWGQDVIAEWPDGSMGCCGFLYPWPCDVGGQRECCAWPGDATFVGKSTDLNDIAACWCP